MSLTEFVRQQREQITRYVVGTYGIRVTSDAERREFVRYDPTLARIARQVGVEID